MKRLFLKSAVLLSPGSSFHTKTCDVFIDKGVISAIGESLEIPEGAAVIDAAGKYLSPGFFDLNVNFGEPGLETKEDLETGTSAAAAGGFTGLALMPNTNPPVHSKSEVAYIVNKSREYLVDVFPLGAISQGREGKDLAELYDMSLAGAIAFTDGNKPVADSGLMSRAMLYAKGFNGLVFSYAEDPSLAGKGKMNEGEVSTYLGMKGIPSLAEEIMVARDIYLAAYNGSKIHFSTLSTAHSIDLVRSAKKKGLPVTCDVAAHHLVFMEDELAGFDSNYKVKPPFRTANDIEALLEGLNDGTIDAIVSQHTPHEIEFKAIEFEIAYYGITGLQTVLPLLVRAGLSPEIIAEKLAVNPRKIVNLPVPEVKEGADANFVLFDTVTPWTLDEQTNRSKSYNSPLMGSELTGKVWMVVNNKQFDTF